MIQQVKFSKSVIRFQQPFCERWNVVNYKDINMPCFFAGVYKQGDVDAINDHRGFKVVWNTRWNNKIKDLFKGIHPENVIVCVGMGVPFDLEGYRVKYASFEIKDFSMFRPNILGDKIYCYINSDKRKVMYGYDILEGINTGFDVVYGRLGNTMEYVKKNYYDKCFVNIKIDKIGGMTTSTELALMGRRSISNAPLPFCEPYSNISDIKNIIEKESKKIGTIQPSQIGGYFDTGEEWKNINFWL